MELDSDPFFPGSDLTIKEFISSPNNKVSRSMLRPKINLIFSRLVEEYCSKLKNYSFIRCLKGDALTNYGDYVCLSVLEVCEELRRKHPNHPDILDQKSPREIAEKILDGLRRLDLLRLKINGVMINFINQCSIQVHDAGIITFRLDDSWIDHRINDMLTNGIHTWAPTFYTKKKAKAIFVSHALPESEGDLAFLVYCMKNALAKLFLYSGIDVLVSERPDVDVDLQTIKYGVLDYNADVLVYLMPHLRREYIEEGFADARKQKWFKAGITLASCGYRIPCSNNWDELVKMWFMFRDDPRFGPLNAMARKFHYDPEEFFHSIVKYTLLKKYRMAEITFILEEMIDMEGNTLVNILKTESIIKDKYLPPRTSLSRLSESKKVKSTKASKKEHELGLHLVQFTWVIEKACQNFMTHIVCDYMFELSGLFMSYYREVQHDGKVNLQLCEATHLVICHCLQLLGLGIDHESLHVWRTRMFRSRPQEITPNDHRFSQSRFELFTMRVFVAHPDFDNGSIFGNIWVRDANLARKDGWTKLGIKESCYVNYFKHDWDNPLDIYYGCLIPFGDPSGRRSVPISSSLEVDVMLHGMSKNKQHCYLVFHDKNDEPISKKWVKEGEELAPETFCGTLDLQSNVGNVQINYMLLKNAMDASIELPFESSNLGDCVKICGYITAYYEDVVKDDVLGRYKAVIFRTNSFELTGEQGVLPLHKSLLAVPVTKILKIKAKLDDVVSGKEYVRETWDYQAGQDKNWLMKCGNFSIKLKVTGSRQGGFTSHFLG